MEMTANWIMTFVVCFALALQDGRRGAGKGCRQRPALAFLV